MAQMQTAPMTLDFAQEAFEAAPSAETALVLRRIAHEYFSDDMIGEETLRAIVEQSNA
jgi:hypothetical protein